MPDPFSLEFAPYGFDAAAKRLSAFGAVKVDQRITYDRLHIDTGGTATELLYLNEWDEPCLISSSAAGHDVLRQLSIRSD